MAQGYPVQIVVAQEDHKFILDENALVKVLLRPDVQDKKVVVISLTGAFRKGKSFLLDFFLRYQIRKGSQDWLGDLNAPLEGFPWRGGSERDTTGILLWSEPFLVQTSNGEVAVILMDTQGAFDSQSTVRDCATVFALSTMVSSVQVYNLSQNIQENDLQHLQLFTEYGRLALEANENSAKPFQTLTFLVRDWSFQYECEYGLEGGKEILEKRLKIGGRQHLELQQLRKHIRSCFTSINCFLMPHPGLKVTNDPQFNGCLKDIEPDFREQLQILVEHLLAPEKLVVKEINGSEVSCRELVEYFKAYMKIYQGEELPEPKSMLQATAEANNLAAVSSARNEYIKAMEEAVGGNRPYVHPDRLKSEHDKKKKKAMNEFRHARKMGGPEFSSSYEQKLIAELEEAYENLCKHNKTKNFFSTARTPIVLVIMCVLSYLLAGIFALLGLSPVVFLFNTFMWLMLILVITIVYVRYSGVLINIGHQIDKFANFIWEWLMERVFALMLQRYAVQILGIEKLKEN